MGLSSVMQWWEEWQLRVLVLGSLWVQFFLSFADVLRKMHKVRKLVWIAYISGDALAIYALATLFNRRHGTVDGGGTALEVVWAPVLLIHLGGQRAISAYSLEDNELWKRHALTLVSQVTVALYVFCKWWSGDEKLLQAAVLLFIVGIVKFAQKPWALRKASFNSILTITSVSRPSTRQAQEEVANPRCWTMFTSSLQEMDLRMQKGREDDERASMSLEEYVQQASMLFGDQTAEDGQQEERDKLDYFVNKLFVDLSVPYAGRLMELRSFAELDDKSAYHKLQMSLRSIFSLLYTKEKALNLLGCSMQMLLPFLAVASVVLFAKTSKDGYDGRDVMVTYNLFCCTAAQELSPWFPCIYCCALCLLTSCLCFCFPRVSIGEEVVSQHNLLAVCARKKKPTFLMKIATFIFLREYINENCYIEQVAEDGGPGAAASRITRLVHRHVKGGWRKYIHGDAARYRCFANLRGQRSMRRHHQLRRLGWSLDMPFDESVLLWHIATDLCFFHHHNNSNQSGIFSPKEGGEATSTTAMQRAREISNYMVYLLCMCPEMLLPGTRLGLFTAACDNIELILKDSRAAELHKEQRLAQEIVERVKSSSSATTNAEGTSTSLVTDGCRLVEALMEMSNEKERWQMIQGVWVEMLCYSAVRCRGYLHAKSLGEGGEFLSTVWLLWLFMGMETMPDRFQRPEPPKEEEEEEDDDDDDDDDVYDEAGHGSGASSTRPTQGDGHDDQAAEISLV